MFFKLFERQKMFSWLICCFSLFPYHFCWSSKNLLKPQNHGTVTAVPVRTCHSSETYVGNKQNFFLGSPEMFQEMSSIVGRFRHKSIFRIYAMAFHVTKHWKACKKQFFGEIKCAAFFILCRIIKKNMFRHSRKIAYLLKS